MIGRVTPRWHIWTAFLFLLVTVCFLRKFEVKRSRIAKIHAPFPPAEIGKSDRPLILYSYFEAKNAQVNLKFFIKHGLHAQADFIFILNGENEAENMIPKEPNIRYVKRENKCYDLGAYAEILLKDSLYKRYKKFIMLNASLRGPFLPYWSKSCWSDMYLERVTDEVKMVGMSANCWPLVHVQTPIVATDSIGIKILLFPPEAAAAELNKIPKYKDNGMWPPYPGINECFSKYESAVAMEIGSSALIIAAGYKLDVMLSSYHSSELVVCGDNRPDFMRMGTYYGISYHPFETIFFKTTRAHDAKVLDRYTEWADGRNYSSYEFCKG